MRNLNTQKFLSMKFYANVEVLNDEKKQKKHGSYN